MGGQDDSEREHIHRLLLLWGRLAGGQGIDTDDMVDMFQLLRRYFLRAAAARRLLPQDREDCLMGFLHDKLLCSGGAVRAPLSHAEFNAFVRNYISDESAKGWRRHEIATDASTLEQVSAGGEPGTQGGSGCAHCGAEDLASQATARFKRERIGPWLQDLSQEEQSLVWGILCCDHSATDAIHRLGMTSGAYLVKRLGIRLASAHKDGAWSPATWLKSTKLGALFQSLGITPSHDMLTDARQVLGLICQLLALRWGDRRGL